MVIYRITNLITNKIYIGQTTKSINERFKEHCKPNNGCRHLKNAISKYGKENFKIEVIENCNSIDEMNEREEYWISELNSLTPNGYNIRKGGNNHEIAEETRRLLSLKGSGTNNPFYGKHHSVETIEELRAINIGKKQSVETRMKRSQKEIGELNHFYGKKHTDATKDKIRKARANYVGIKHPRCRRVICVETGKIYDYIRQAQNETGINECHISSCCKGKLKTAGKYHWKYSD